MIVEDPNMEATTLNCVVNDNKGEYAEITYLRIQ